MPQTTRATAARPAPSERCTPSEPSTPKKARARVSPQVLITMSRVVGQRSAALPPSALPATAARPKIVSQMLSAPPWMPPTASRTGLMYVRTVKAPEIHSMARPSIAGTPGSVPPTGVRDRWRDPAAVEAASAPVLRWPRR
jgi:hypothetical protein